MSVRVEIHGMLFAFRFAHARTLANKAMAVKVIWLCLCDKTLGSSPLLSALWFLVVVRDRLLTQAAFICGALIREDAGHFRGTSRLTRAIVDTRSRVLSSDFQHGPRQTETKWRS